MDILQLIQEKTRFLPQDNHILGIKAVVSHIQTAEKYWLRGKKEGDENLFTDVIYRANHAFEGILKEAYSILAEKDADKRTPNEIEQYLTNNNVFKPRLMDLFKNYRTEWRNPSTHDYNLFFTEEEALLAIVSVSAFVNILLDQIVEKVSYTAEKAKTVNQVEPIRNNIAKYANLPLKEKIRELFLAFSKDMKITKQDGSLQEIQIIGLLSGFIAAVDPMLKIQQEIEIGSGKQRLRIDMLFSFQDEQVIIEIKRGMPSPTNLAGAQDQLSLYLLKTGIHEGIIYFIPTNPSFEMHTDDVKVEFDKVILNITRIYPMVTKHIA